MLLRIEQDWAGAPADRREHVALELHPEAEALEIRIDAPYHADPPPPGPARKTDPADHLWDYEVVEVFLLAPDERYLELEFSPHGHWLALQLAGVRQPNGSIDALDYEATINGARWQARARVPWREVPEDASRLNAYATHGTGPSRRYLAWQPVPGESPDFHRLKHFAAFELPAASRPSGAA